MILASSTTDDIAAAGTLVAALAAIGAFIVALTLLMPQWQDFRSKREDRIRHDARLVTVYARDRKTDAESRFLVICNRSEQPVYKCLLWLITPSKNSRDKTIPPFAFPVSRWTTAAPPREDSSYELGSTRNRPRPWQIPPVEMVFFDANQDKYWWRDENGRLHELGPERVEQYNDKYNEILEQYRRAPDQEPSEPAEDA